MKISRNGLLCLAPLGLLLGLLPATAPVARAQAATEQQPPAQQSPPQQPPAQPPTTPPTQPPTTPPTQPPAESPQEPSQRPVRLPPAPPKVIDVRMPGEAGWFVGLTGWLPVGATYEDKGHGAAFTDLSALQNAGTSKGAPGAEFGVAAGLHNSIRVSYWFGKQSGTTTAPTDLVIFSQPYSKGDQLTTNAKLTNVKLSFEYLTWPYPVEARKFRLKTLWQAQYVNMRTIYDNPIKSATPDSSGNFTSYSTVGSKGFFSPTLGLGFHEYATRNFHLEANVSGFAWPHSFQILDTDGTMAYRFGHLELRAGGKFFHYRTSPKADYFFRANLGGAFIGIRWYSD